MVWGRPGAAGVWVTRAGGMCSPVSLFGKQLSCFLWIKDSPAYCVHASRSNIVHGLHRVSSFRKLFIDKAAGSDSQLPYDNRSLLSENRQTGQKLLLLFMRLLPLEPYLCPPYLITDVWEPRRAIETHLVWVASFPACFNLVARWLCIIH